MGSNTPAWGVLCPVQSDMPVAGLRTSAWETGTPLHHARNESAAVKGGRLGSTMAKSETAANVQAEKPTLRNERAEVHKAIWKIADDLRGKVTGWNFMIYVLGTIFYRFISEMLESHMNGYQRKAGRTDFVYGDLPDEKADRARKTITDMLGYYIPPSRLFRNVREKERDNPDLNIFLGDALTAIEESAKGTETERDFKGLFAGLDFNNSQILGDTVPERNKYIVKILDGIASMDLGGFSEHSIDVFGDAYEFLMTMYASNAGKSGGEFFTPQQVSRLLALIATRGKKKIANVYDPACGSGSLLMQVAKVIGKDNVTDGFYGQETEPTTHRLCRMNLFLHGISPHKFDIHKGDTLLAPSEFHKSRKPFEIVVSNPPYSTKWDGDGNPVLVSDERFAPAGALAPKKAADFAFIMHTLSWLAPNGTAAIVCFPGIFYRTSNKAEPTIRKYLVENNFVDAVIDLPPNLFFGNNSIAVTILVLKKNKTNDNTVLFIDGKDQFIKDGNKNRLTDENIGNIFQLYCDRKEVPHRAAVVPFEKIQEEGFNLSVSTYVEPEDKREKVDISKLNAEIAEMVKRQSEHRNAVDAFVKEYEK